MKQGDISDFLKVLQKCEEGFPPAMQEAAQKVADTWVSKAKGAAKHSQQARAAQSLVASVSAEGAQIRSDLPWFHGAEFGGGGRPETRQFPPYQGKRGYFLYPAARANKAEFSKIWGAGVDAAMKAWG